MTRQFQQFPWVAATAGALLVAAGGFSLLRLPPPPRPEAIVQPDAAAVPLSLGDVGAEQVGPALAEELLLRDPTPLFLPTRWNSGQAPAPAGERLEPGESFGRFEEKLAFAEDDARIVLPAIADVPETALGVIERVSQRPDLRELARQDIGLAPLAPRLATLLVSKAENGEVQLEENVSELPDTEASLLRQELWSPVELLVAVGPGGLMGRPAFVLGSGSERIDNWVLQYLTVGMRLGARLEPGFYRVVVGP